MTSKKIANNVSELVGNTPLLKINNQDPDLKAELVGKLESFNPLSSVKDRISVGMIDKAEEEGLIDKDTVLIEPTSGNTGIGLAFVAASRGYRLILTMPDTMSIERRKLLAIFGAEIVLTPGANGMNGAIAKTDELLEEIDNSFSVRQFSNPVNVETHYNTTAEEIWNDTDGNVDIVVGGVGTGGTVTGVGKKLKESDKNPDVKIVAVEPASSPVLSGENPGPHKIQGIGAGFVPDIYQSELIDEIIQVKDEDASKTMLSLAAKEGILVGISSGAAAYAGIQLAKKEENKGKRIVVILPDTGERYLSMDWVFEDIYKEYSDVL
ncbi:MAG: cysteine synthase A [Methanobrevibacter arboriphilus]|jgi:cysteine synthase A|uniref:Cysteine synthase A n=2 Tax=Methanobrevibacter arboriphilus TaxID=39441 RepID=A0ACA8R173_METAZ|nr:cysteine synthase A [Methanobrevibacter arboriphilus]MBF4468492.1 cysteine synthase A [Methanobrevibacter arboriphilus]BBL61110.1 cysteine synthase A [Methanobrevibacter arboriphilus]